MVNNCSTVMKDIQRTANHTLKQSSLTHTHTRIDRNTNLHSLISLFFKGGVLGVELKARF